MTSNNTLKKLAREHAARTGVSYTQARREIMAEHEKAQHETETLPEPTPVVWVGIQQAVRDDGSTPLPFTFDQHGYVDNQDFWRGDPWRVIGFVADPDEHVIDVQREDFLSDPERVVGMHPVLMDRKDRSWSTWRGAVEEVETRTLLVVDPETVLARFVGRGDGTERTLTIGVAHVLKALKAGEVEQMRAETPKKHPAAEDLLSVLCMTGDERALEFSAIFDDIEDENGEPAEMDLRVALDAAEVDTWLSTGRGYRRS